MTETTSGLFSLLSQAHRTLLLAHAELIQCDKDTILLQEGVHEPYFYSIIEGEVEVFKHSGNHDHALLVLGPGEIVGEMALLDDVPRSASVRCITPCTVYKFDIVALRADLKMSDVLATLEHLIHQKITDRLRATNDVTVAALTSKFELSIFSLRILILFAIYTLSLNLIEKSERYFSSTTPLSLGLILIFTAVLVSIVRQSNHPLAFYGVTLKNAAKNMREAFWLSLPIMGLIVLIKGLAITYIPALHHVPLFDHTATLEQGHVFHWDIYFISMGFYALFCPVQEFLARGCVQTALQHLFHGSSPARITWKAIIISNLIFASVHSHTSIGFALSAFIPGLFWGWLYHRQGSLVGVSLSHILIGVWAAFVVGFQNII